MSKRNQLIKQVSVKLLWPLVALVGVFCLLLFGTSVFQGRVKEFAANLGPATPGVVVVVGMVGGFVSLQRRLHELPEEKLELMANSIFYTILTPVVGGILAYLLYMLFMADMLQGTFFPKFELDQTTPYGTEERFLSIFQTHTTYKGYAALVFWSFVAGYSEKFVVNIIGRFEPEAASRAPSDEAKGVDRESIAAAASNQDTPSQPKTP